MNDTIREQLSALADGELGGEGRRFLLKRLDHDHEVRSVWERYHLIRDCLREPAMRFAPNDFCARVASAIASESDAPGQALGGVSASLPAAVSGPARARPWAGFLGLTIAASVSALALFGARLDGPPADPAAGSANVSQLAPLTTSDLVPAWRIPGVAETQRFLLVPSAPPTNELDTYFLRHGEASGELGTLGLVPSVRAVAATADFQAVDASGRE